MESQTILNQREILANGIIQLRFAKIVVNGDVLVSNGWHRAAIVPGCNIDSSLAAINAHLATMGFPAITDADTATIKSTAGMAWTPAVLAAYAAAAVPA